MLPDRQDSGFQYTMRIGDRMGICSCVNSAKLSNANPPAVSDNQDAKWVPAPTTGNPFDIHLIKRQDYDAFNKQYGYGPNAMAICFIGTDDALIREEFWPQSGRPDAAGYTGYLDSKQLPYIFSNLLQEGIFLHECLGHGLHKAVHEANADPNYHGQNHADKDPSCAVCTQNGTRAGTCVCMETPENLPAQDRLALMSEFASKSPFIHIAWWVPGEDVLADGDKQAN